MQNSRNTNFKKFLNYESCIVADVVTAQLTDLTGRIINDSDRLVEIASKWGNCSAEITQGRMFEQLETIKFNSDSLGKGAKLYAVTTDSLGDPHAPADILIKKGKTIVREAQAKSYSSAARSLHSQADAKYEGMQRVIPVEQEAKAKDLAKKRIDSNTLKADRYKETHKNLTGKLSHDDVSSEGTTRQESIDAVSNAEELARKCKNKAIISDMHYSGLEAAKIGGCASAAFSSIRGAYKLVKDDANVGEVVCDLTVDTACGAVTAYVSTALSKGIIHSAPKVMSQTVVNGLAKSNAHVAIAAGVVQCGKSMCSYINGDIDAEELFEQTSHTAITGASAFYYGALGQAIIPIPIVGALIGSTVGYFVGNLLYQSGLLSLGTCEVVRIARERRQAIEQLCMTAIPLIRAHRLNLEHFFEHRAQVVANNLRVGFDGIEKSIMSFDPNSFQLNLENIANIYSNDVQFLSFEEFDVMMHDNNAVFDF